MTIKEKEKLIQERRDACCLYSERNGERNCASGLTFRWNPCGILPCNDQCDWMQNYVKTLE